MTNDTRHRLEDAIISYGAAKALHAATEAEFREMAHEACAEAWDRVEICLDELQQGSDEDGRPAA